MNERKEPTFSTSPNSPADSSSMRAASPQTSRSQNPIPKPQSSKVIIQKQSFGFLWFISLLTLLVAAGVVYTFWQLQQSQQLILAQQSRIDELEDRLLLTGDESTQSLTALTSNVKGLDKGLKVAMSEIDKLWATRKASLNEVAKVKSELNKILKDGVSKTNSAIAALESKLTQPVASIKQRTGEQEILIQSLRERVSDQGKTAQSLSSQIKQYASTSKQTKAISAKVDGYEETFRSFDKFRITTNRDLLLLKERAGVLSAPVR
jgi:small-conductance mechanosensitive channel